MGTMGTIVNIVDNIKLIEWILFNYCLRLNRNCKNQIGGKGEFLPEITKVVPRDPLGGSLPKTGKNSPFPPF